MANLTLVAMKLGMMGTANQPGASFFALFYQGFMIAITTHMLKLSAMTMRIAAWPTGRLCLAEGAFGQISRFVLLMNNRSFCSIMKL